MGNSPGQSNFWQRWGASAFTLDLRSLALFRMAIGALLLADLAFRGQVLQVMYTDAGVVQRDSLWNFMLAIDRQGLWQWGTGTWSLHFLSGETGPTVVLFAVAGVFALLMMVGKWTRLATIASFLMLVSLHSRNPFVLHSGDTMMRLTMFWAMFLPLGEIWSLDARGRLLRGVGRPPSTAYCSPASAGLVFQVFILYFFTGLAKCNALWWQGDAMFVILNLSLYVRDIGQQLRNWPWLHQAISIATVATEIILPPLLLVGYKNNWWRWLNLITFCGLHIGVLICMSIGLFSFICCGIWLALIPGGFWDRVGIRAGLSSAVREPLAATGRARTGFASSGRRWVDGFCLVMIPYMLLWNVLNIVPALVSRVKTETRDGIELRQVVQRDSAAMAAYEWFGQALGVGQHFQMFGQPYREDPWFIYRGRLADGSQADIFNGGRDLTDTASLHGIDGISTFHWRKLHHDLVDNIAIDIRYRLLEYQINQWNQSHPPDQQIVSATLECYLDTVWPTPMLGETRGASIWAQYPKDQPPSNAFDQLYDQVIGEGENPGF